MVARGVFCRVSYIESDARGMLRQASFGVDVFFASFALVVPTINTKYLFLPICLTCDGNRPPTTAAQHCSPQVSYKRVESIDLQHSDVRPFYRRLPSVSLMRRTRCSLMFPSDQCWKDCRSRRG